MNSTKALNKSKTAVTIRLLLAIGFSIAFLTLYSVGAFESAINLYMLLGTFFFVGTIVAWVKFSSQRKQHRVLQAILSQQMQDVRDIATFVRLHRQKVVGFITKCMRKGYLPGYRLNGDFVYPMHQSSDPFVPTPFHQPSQPTPTAVEIVEAELVEEKHEEFDLVCPHCGGITTVVDTHRARCQYCGRMISDGTKA